MRWWGRNSWNVCSAMFPHYLRLLILLKRRKLYYQHSCQNLKIWKFETSFSSLPSYRQRSLTYFLWLAPSFLIVHLPCRILHSPEVRTNFKSFSSPKVIDDIVNWWRHKPMTSLSAWHDVTSGWCGAAMPGVDEKKKFQILVYIFTGDILPRPLPSLRWRFLFLRVWNFCLAPYSHSYRLYYYIKHGMWWQMNVDGNRYSNTFRTGKFSNIRLMHTNKAFVGGRRLS